MSANRHLGRIVALQTLYEQDFREACQDKNFKLEEALKRNVSRYRNAIKDGDFVNELVRGVNQRRDELDKLLQPIAPDWPIDQIARMDRVVLRLGAYELLHGKNVPPKVVINEAVELAKAFGGDNSSKFINGVMGTLMRQHVTADKPEGEDAGKAKKETKS